MFWNWSYFNWIWSLKNYCNWNCIWNWSLCNWNGIGIGHLKITVIVFGIGIGHLKITVIGIVFGIGHFVIGMELELVTWN